MCHSNSEVRRIGWLAVGFDIAIGGLICWSLLSILGTEIARLSLASHFQVYQACAWGGVLFGSAICSWFGWTRRGKSKRLWAGLPFFTVHVVLICTGWLPQEKRYFESYDAVEIVWFNMSFDKQAIRQLEACVKDTPPDIIVVCEIGNDAEISMPGFPYRHRSREANILIASRFPLGDQDLLWGSEGARSFLGTRVQVGTTEFYLIALHFHHPIYRVHYEEFGQLEEILQTTTQVIVVGDFNSTVWSAPLRHLIRYSGAKHAREGLGVLNSWAPHHCRWMPLPIDHMLYSGEVELHSFEILPWTLSDHRPLKGVFHIQNTLAEL